MAKLTIDQREVEVAEGSTVLDAARALGIDIPTLCHLDGCDPQTSCLVCLVRVGASDRLVPACATKVTDGMQVESETEPVRAARRTALELLLSDHLGDCMAPCHRICPAHMNIPLMARQIHGQQWRDALITLNRDIALPAVVARLCHRPCESGCRRAAWNEAASIRDLERHIADVNLASDEPYLPACRPATGKRITIVGAGPTGLAAAFCLLQLGHACVIFDDRDRPGGMLLDIDEQTLPADVLDGEVARIKALGAEFRMNVRIGEALPLQQLRDEFDAVLLAVGPIQDDLAEQWQLATNHHGVQVDAQTLATNLNGVYAAGDVVRRRQQIVHCVAAGKSAAYSITQALDPLPLIPQQSPFSCHIGRMHEDELAVFTDGASAEPRANPTGEPTIAMTDAQAQGEAGRCLHCDCHSAGACRLRSYAQSYGARPGRFGAERRRFERHPRPANVVFEPGKCITCGLCVQIAADAAEPLGLTFVGRGFDVRLTVPFGGSFDDGMQTTAAECVAACPTGAIYFAEPANVNA